VIFYGAEQAGIHDHAFGMLAAHAAARTLALLAESALDRGTVVDLGCGSGILARRLTDAGYDVVGFDISPDMVALAAANAPAASFHVGSLYDATLADGCAAVTATGEALNYGADPAAGTEALADLAGRVREALVPGGWWLFDVSGPGRAGPSKVTKQFHRHDDWCLGMTATESDDGRRLDREITIFSRQDEGAYRRIEEHHVLHLYDEADIVSLLRRVGFTTDVRRSWSDDRPELPGWYVVEARQPR
jgi:SAM-dependent methyltransferase